VLHPPQPKPHRLQKLVSRLAGEDVILEDIGMARVKGNQVGKFRIYIDDRPYDHVGTKDGVHIYRPA